MVKVNKKYKVTLGQLEEVRIAGSFDLLVLLSQCPLVPLRFKHCGYPVWDVEGEAGPTLIRDGKTVGIG